MANPNAKDGILEMEHLFTLLAAYNLVRRKPASGQGIERMASKNGLDELALDKKLSWTKNRT